MRQTLFRNIGESFYGTAPWTFRLWVRLVFILAILAVVGGFVYTGLDLIFWQHGCYYPYHLVYTGWRDELIGKVVEPVDQYACVPN